MPWQNKSTSTSKTSTRRIVGLAAAAEYADVSPKTMRRWIAAGTIPAGRNGRLIKVDLNDVDAALRPVQPSLSR